MTPLIDYIVAHTTRGECQCGQCIDKGPDRPAPEHSVDVHFFWVSAKDDPKAEELRALLEIYYPGGLELIKPGPSYIVIGVQLGDQDLALRLIGLGALVGLWKVITPRAFGFEGERANEMAGLGLVMPAGLKL